MDSVKNKKGFTLIEIVLVITILGFVAVLVSQPFVSFRNAIILKSATEDVFAFIEEARVLTMASYEESNYGVHFSSDSMVLFAGDTYSPSDPENEERMLDSAILMSSINLAGSGSDIIFNRLDGTTNQFGTLLLAIISDASKTRTINIYANGTMDLDYE